MGHCKKKMQSPGNEVAAIYSWVTRWKVFSAFKFPVKNKNNPLISRTTVNTEE